MSNNPSPANIAPSPTTSINTTSLMKPSVTKIVTSKEWVLPPRPKPGRKPSADTPATKRKAQNRAAQRAFRERRATRVQELEEKLMELEKEKELSEISLKSVVTKLDRENKSLVRTIEEMRGEFSGFKRQMLMFQQQQMNSSSTGLSPGSSSPLSYQTTASSYQNPQLPVRSRKNSSNGRQTISPAMSYKSPREYTPIQPALPSQPSPREIQQLINIQPSPISTPISKNSISSSNSSSQDCGVCIKDDCICAAVGIRSTPPTSIQPETTANVSRIAAETMTPVALKKRPRKPFEDQIEVDFTGKFLKNKFNKPLKKFKKKLIDDSSQIEFTFDDGKEINNDFQSPLEECGFCSDDSPCVCREAAKEAANAITELQSRSKSISDITKTLPPISRNSSISNIQKLPVFHPGPTVEISSTSITSSSSIELESKSSNSSITTTGCTGNPGTCGQCQMDPMSTLFCTTIASKADEEQVDKTSPVSPPLSKVSSPYQITDDNELKSITNPVIENIPIDSTKGGIYIPCADAYKTLSRHKGFNSVDFGTLVGKLTTRGMQVEVRSVANVLRELDRKVYN